MATCHSCKTSEEIKNGLWKDVPFSQIPCSKCTLNESSLGTFELKEGHIANSSEDNPDDEEWTPEAADAQSLQPFDGLDGENPGDPHYPLSTLISAMSMFLSLSLPARKCIQLRMRGFPYSVISERLGSSRQNIEKLVAQALAREPLLQNLLPAKSGRGASPLTATRKPAMADCDKSSQKCQKSPF